MFFYGTSEYTIIYYIYHYTPNTFISHKKPCHELTQIKITHFIPQKCLVGFQTTIFVCIIIFKHNTKRTINCRYTITTNVIYYYMSSKIDKIYNQSRDFFHYNILNLFVPND